MCLLDANKRKQVFLTLLVNGDFRHEIDRAIEYVNDSVSKNAPGANYPMRTCEKVKQALAGDTGQSCLSGAPSASWTFHTMR